MFTMGDDPAVRVTITIPSVFVGQSDGVALLMNDGDVVGEYSAGVSEGIRRYPYFGYPLTYGDVTGDEVLDDDLPGEFRTS